MLKHAKLLQAHETLDSNIGVCSCLSYAQIYVSDYHRFDIFQHLIGLDWVDLHPQGLTVEKSDERDRIVRVHVDHDLIWIVTGADGPGVSCLSPDLIRPDRPGHGENLRCGVDVPHRSLRRTARDR